MDAGLLSVVVDRLEGAQLDEDVEIQVLAACEGLLDDVLGDGE